MNALPGRRIKFLPTAIVLGLISIIGATFFGLLAQFTTFLVTIGALFAPIFAIMIVDYYVIKRSSYDRDILQPAGGRYWYTGGINWLAIGAWLVGAVLAYVWAYVWPLPFGSTAPAFIVTFVVYLLVSWPSRPKGPITQVGNLADAAEASTAVKA